MAPTDGSAGFASPCLWFEVERPVVGHVFVAHRDGLVLATKLADPPEEPALSAEAFVDYMRGEFGERIERDHRPETSWPFNQVREPFEAADLVALSSLTGFQRKVMNATARIPPGEWLTYGEVAEDIGGIARSVGQAMKSNPAPLVIPCHRVVAQNDLGGWVYGEDLKWKLLKDEGAPDPRRRPRRTSRPSTPSGTSPVVAPRSSLEERIRGRESERMEFKPKAGVQKGPYQAKAQHDLVKTVCGFLNAKGGELVIGVEDDGRPRGLARDHPPGKRIDADWYERRVREILAERLNVGIADLVATSIEDYQGCPVCVVAVRPSPSDPVFAQPLSGDRRSWKEADRDDWVFYVRDGNATRQYKGERRSRYVLRRYSNA